MIVDLLSFDNSLAVKGTLDDNNISNEEAAKCESEDDECLPSFHGLGKGYRFFKDGRVHSIQLHPTHDSLGFCFVRAQVLHSMVKSRKYSVRICLTSGGNVHTAYCVCPAGCCNHVATLLHAFEEFLLLGLREESKVPCTSHLQQYKQPRCRNVPLCGCSNNKRRYGKQKRRKLVQPLYEPHPLNICLPKTENAAERTRNSDNWQCGQVWIVLLAEVNGTQQFRK